MEWPDNTLCLGPSDDPVEVAAESNQLLPFGANHRVDQCNRTLKLRAAELPINAARRAHNIACGELAERDARELLAIRLSTPAYVIRELGGRPSDRRSAQAWDRSVTAIQSYRREREITDTANALGERPKAGIDRAAQEMAQRRVREVQRRLAFSTARANTVGGEGRGP